MNSGASPPSERYLPSSLPKDELDIVVEYIKIKWKSYHIRGYKIDWDRYKEISKEVMKISSFVDNNLFLNYFADNIGCTDLSIYIGICLEYFENAYEN